MEEVFGSHVQVKLLPHLHIHTIFSFLCTSYAIVHICILMPFSTSYAKDGVCQY